MPPRLMRALALLRFGHGVRSDLRQQCVSPGACEDPPRRHDGARVDSADLYTDLSRQIRFSAEHRSCRVNERMHGMFHSHDSPLMPTRLTEAFAAAAHPNGCSEDRAP